MLPLWDSLKFIYSYARQVDVVHATRAGELSAMLRPQTRYQPPTTAMTITTTITVVVVVTVVEIAFGWSGSKCDRKILCDYILSNSAFRQEDIVDDIVANIAADNVFTKLTKS